MKISHSLLFTIAVLFAFPFSAMSVYAQSLFRVEYRQNGENIKGAILGNHIEYKANNNCPYHRTKLGRSFAHIHVAVPSPLVAYVPVPNPLTGEDDWEYKGPFTMSDVDAYWDWWFDNGAGGRANFTAAYSYGRENLTQNCWGYSLGYDTWVQDPDPIYEDNCTRLANQNWPLAYSDVVRGREQGKDTHVVMVGVIDHTPTRNVVMITEEKFRHSGMYYVVYIPPDFCQLGDYWRKKP